jgi:hypothetical protein
MTSGLGDHQEIIPQTSGGGWWVLCKRLSCNPLAMSQASTDELDALLFIGCGITPEPAIISNR